MRPHISETISWLKEDGSSLKLELSSPFKWGAIHGVNNTEKQIILFDLGFLPSLSWNSRGLDFEFWLFYIHKTVYCHILKNFRLFICHQGATAPMYKIVVEIEITYGKAFRR